MKTFEMDIMIFNKNETEEMNIVVKSKNKNIQKATTIMIQKLLDSNLIDFDDYIVFSDFDNDDVA